MALLLVGSVTGVPLAHADTATVLTLEDLLARVVSDPRARMAREDTAVAEALVTQASGARYPSFDITAFLAPSPDIDCQEVNCTRTSPDDFSLSLDAIDGGVYGGARITAYQPLYTFGKLDSITTAAKAAVRASRALQGVTQNELALQAIEAYFGLKLARELTWMLEDGLSEIDGARVRIQNRLDEGDPEVTLQDRLRVETLAAEVTARLAEARQAEAIALAGMRILAGDDTADIANEALEPIEFELAATSVYLDIAREKRPEIRAAHAGAEAAWAQTHFESAHYFPDLVLVGELGLARAQGVDDPPSAFADDPFNRTSAALGLALRWRLDPIQQQGRVAQAAARARKAEALVDLATIAAKFDIERSHAEASQAHARLVAARDGSKSARGWMAAVMQADAIGTAESKDLADAFIAYFTLRARYVTSVYEWNLAVARLRTAAGQSPISSPSSEGDGSKRPAASRSHHGEFPVTGSVDQ